MPKPLTYRHILIIADIEGSSGCGSYRASSFLTKPWARACAAMSRDVVNIHTLYNSLIRLCYLTPLAEKTLPLSLGLYHLAGRLGRIWARRQLTNGQRH